MTTTAREEQDYHRKVAQFARANEKAVAKVRADTVNVGLATHLHGGSAALKMLNAAFKQRRLAGLTTLRYGVAKKRFEKLLAERLVEGLRNGDLKTVIDAALS